MVLHMLWQMETAGEEVVMLKECQVPPPEKISEQLQKKIKLEGAKLTAVAKMQGETPYFYCGLSKNIE